ncbi:sensor histidine kinase [Roseivirga sp.]|uniref:sensor histidine kinase n=1 Tax=Roseivirga sp. TaxID=1964215 RepID=UPI003B8B4DCB
MRILISVLLLVCCVSVKAQEAIITKGKLPLGIKVMDREGNAYDPSSFYDGFDDSGLPKNLVIPYDAIIVLFLPTITDENKEGYTFGRRSDSKLKPIENFGADYGGKKVALLGSVSHSPASKGTVLVNYTDGHESTELINFQYRIDYKSPMIEEVLLGSEIVELIKESYGKDIFDITTRKYDVWKEKGYTSTGGTELPTDLVLPQNENAIYINITGNYEETDLIVEKDGKVLEFKDNYMLFNWVMGLTDLKPGEYKITVVNDQKAYGSNTDTFEFTIKRDFWKMWGYWIIIAFALTLIFFIIYRINVSRKLQNADLLKQLSEAELKAIRSQLNPHFLFNALNAIQNLVNKNDTEKANDYIVKLSRLMRTVLSQSDESLHSIDEEIKLSQLYLALENMRNPFDFEIEVAEAIDQNLLVPTMILQPYLENAVLHGVGNCGATEIKVQVNVEHSSLVLQISDNGKPATTEIKEGRGMSLGKERMEIIRKQLGIESEIGVKTRSSSEKGFVVIIRLPLNL